MEQERKLAISGSGIFITQLSEETKAIIREDLRQYADENGEHLAWDWETNDYVGMSRRFCDIDDIYQNTKLIFCKAGEDAGVYSHDKRDEPIGEHTR